MPFGLCNAPSCFQSLINEVLFEIIDECIIVYLDDILIYSKNEEHKMHLQKVFRKLLENNIYCKKSNCQLFADEVEFLGYEIKKGGMAIATDKIEAIVNYSVPKNKR